jgi:hypothetical protein
VAGELCDSEEGLNSINLWWGSCDYGNEHSSSIKTRGIVEWLENFVILKNDSTPLSYLIVDYVQFIYPCFIRERYIYKLECLDDGE